MDHGSEKARCSDELTECRNAEQQDGQAGPMQLSGETRSGGENTVSFEDAGFSKDLNRLAEGERREEQAEPTQPLRESPPDPSAWEQNGSLCLQCDDQGRTASIEGWVTLSDAVRSKRDREAQKQVVKAVKQHGEQVTTEQDKNEQDEKEWDGTHLFPTRLGGPTEENGYGDMIEHNVIAGGRRMNRSYMSGVESAIKRAAESGQELYLRVSVEHRDALGETWVHHTLFQRNDDGQPAMHERSFSTKLTADPSDTAGRAVKKTTGEAAKDFYSGEGSRGSHRSPSGDH